MVAVIETLPELFRVASIPCGRIEVDHSVKRAAGADEVGSRIVDRGGRLGERDDGSGEGGEEEAAHGRLGGT